MFKSSNFCHVASNNRNNVKAGLFVYRTTDDLATVSASGYFNGILIDLKQHDLIIHEKYDTTDATKVERNVLCVTEKTLDNVGTVVIKSKWEGDIEEDITELQQYVDSTFVKIDGSSTMTAPLKFREESYLGGAIGAGNYGLAFYELDAANPPNMNKLAELGINNGFVPTPLFRNHHADIGSSYNKWRDLYIARVAYIPKINNGYDIAVPVTNSADTFALKSQVDDAANSGEQLYTTGVWFAKMYAATTVPTGAEYDGKNYADFSQVDNDNEPIIVVYEGQSGAWVQIATITPPKNHNGYMTITSKIWDIVEQAGQQGGKVLWSHNNKTFTPYPLIISFESAHLTGDSTVDMPANPTSNSIVNKNYVDSIVPHLSSHDLFDWKMTDHLLSNPAWGRTDAFEWLNNQDAYNHLLNDYQNNTADFYGWTITTPSTLTIYTTSETPKVGDWTYILHNGQMEVFDNITAVSAGSITISINSTADRDSTADTTVAGSALQETIAGTTITYYLAPDGHKICLASEESHVEAMYAATGVAWYYILDTDNTRFKLPRTQFGFTGYRDAVGGYVAPGVPNITGTFKATSVTQYGSTKGHITETSGAFSGTAGDNAHTDGGDGGTNTFGTVSLNASNSSAIYGASTTVQPPATQMYLYMYVGQGS